MYIAEERLGRGNHLTPSNYLARTRYNSALRRRSSGAQARHGDGGGASCARYTTTLARRGAARRWRRRRYYVCALYEASAPSPIHTKSRSYYRRSRLSVQFLITLEQDVTKTNKSFNKTNKKIILKKWLSK